MTNAYLDLARRCEEASGPDRELDAEIAYVTDLLLGGNDPGYSVRYLHTAGNSFADIGKYFEALPRLTASLDAAMSLAVEGISAPDVLRHAIEQCTRYGAPTFIGALPRFVTAQWLRARASLRAKGAGENE